MKKSAYALMFGFAGACTASFVACGGSSDASEVGSGTGGGQSSTLGGASTGSTTTGGQAQAGGSSAETGGVAATGGSATSLQTGGSAASGGSNGTGGATSAAGGTATSGGASATGGATGAVDLVQTCVDVCNLLAGRTTPLECVPADCAGTCNTTYTKLYNAVPACGNDYLAMLKCGATQPADSWTCYPVKYLTVNINLPVPPSALATDPCYNEFQKLFQTIMGNIMTCPAALQ